MSVTDDPKTLGRTRLSFASEADIDEFVDVLDKFERGELTPDQWRVFRLVRGTYGQRQMGDVQMLRVKVPQGILTAAQLGLGVQRGELVPRRQTGEALLPPRRRHTAGRLLRHLLALIAHARGNLPKAALAG